VAKRGVLVFFSLVMLAAAFADPALAGMFDGHGLL
jgi:hypothetical protein